MAGCARGDIGDEMLAAVVEVAIGVGPRRAAVLVAAAGRLTPLVPAGDGRVRRRGRQD